MRSLSIGAIVALVVTMSSPAEAIFRFDPRSTLENQGASASIGARVAAPFGAIVFCQRNGAQCQEQRGSRAATSAGQLVMSGRVMGDLRRVNTQVNRSIRPVAESRRGNADVWSVGGGRGDCEDFALTKRARLLRMGYPSSALLIATGRTHAGAAHAVLVVRTDRGDLVLDNKTGEVRSFSRGLYSWDRIQSPSDPRIWRRL